MITITNKVQDHLKNKGVFINGVKKELNELSKLGVSIPKISHLNIEEIFDPSMSITEATDLVITLNA